MKRIFSFLSISVLIGLLTSCGDTPNSDTNAASMADTIPNMVKIEGSEVSYQSDTVEMKGYIAFDANQTGKRPGILVVHEWWGHSDYVRQRADMLAELGYVALAVDMYGDGKKAEHPEDAMKFSGMVMNNMDEAEDRFLAAYKVLQDNPNVDPSSISAIGYCFGGSLILAMADDGLDLDGVAAFHSGVQLPIMPSEKLKAKVLVQNGADDPFITAEQVAAYKSAMDSVGASYEYIDYPGAVHAYTNPGADELGKKFNLPLAYNEQADKKSWVELQDFLNQLYPRN